MQFNPETDYKKLISELIKKQIVVLGPYITLAKARNVQGLTVADDGTVTEMTGHPQEIIQGLIDQFVQLSGLIVKKTMEPLLAGYPDGITTPSAENQTPQTNVTPPLQTETPTKQAVPQPPPTPAQPVQPTDTNQQTTEPNQSV